MKQFENLEATALFCPKCREAMPVRKRLLLVLLDKELYEYVCAQCGTSVGKKNEPIQLKPGPPPPGGPPRFF